MSSMWFLRCVVVTAVKRRDEGTAGNTAKKSATHGIAASWLFQYELKRICDDTTKRRKTYQLVLKESRSLVVEMDKETQGCKHCPADVKPPKYCRRELVIASDEN